MITISRASSHQNSRSKTPNTVATLAPKATRMAREINSIMPGWRLRSSASPPSRNGRPPYRKTTVPSTGATHREPGELGRGEAQPRLDHLGVDDHRHGQDQAPPEPVPELGGMVPMPTVRTVLATVGAVPTVLAVGGRPAVGVRLGVLAMLVRRQPSGGRTVLATVGAVAVVAGVVLVVVHVAAPHGRTNPRRSGTHQPGDGVGGLDPAQPEQAPAPCHRHTPAIRHLPARSPLIYPHRV
jgi:hypothetical protein